MVSPTATRFLTVAALFSPCGGVCAPRARGGQGAVSWRRAASARALRARAAGRERSPPAESVTTVRSARAAGSPLKSTPQS
ncbi:MAG: hypothetical protein ACRD68_09980, partial [Pyrinomonadaceae bacterium]